MRRRHVAAGRSLLSAYFPPIAPSCARLPSNTIRCHVRAFTSNGFRSGQRTLRPEFVRDSLSRKRRETRGDSEDADYGDERYTLALSEGVPSEVKSTLAGSWSNVGRMIDAQHRSLPAAKLRPDSYPAASNVQNGFWKSLLGNYAPAHSALFDRRLRLVQAAQRVLSNRHLPGPRDKLDELMRSEFYIWYAESRYSTVDPNALVSAANLRYPNEWFAWARRMRRKIVLHIGPTNSGKTHNALKRLEEAKSGIYCGPLRLLAHEVYMRLNAQGTKCALITGDDRRYPDNDLSVSKISCTVEMAPRKAVDVVVVDEIQMIGDDNRGAAWTDIILGADARELHLCGEERALPIIQKLAAYTGDELEVHRYKRLSPLRVEPKSINGDLRKLRKGDCLVCFSVVQIHKHKREIMQLTGKNVAIVYGALPPETRAQQARLFNNPDNDYDYLVASDAIGMGLNLSIRRVVFHSMTKRQPTGRRQLYVNEIKQIAGRAGRYRSGNPEDREAKVPREQSKFLDDETPIEVDPSVQTDEIETGSGSDESTQSETTTSGGTETAPKPDANETVGSVTTLLQSDHEILVKSMASEAQPIETAGLVPPPWLLQQFCQHFEPGTPFTYMYRRMMHLAQLGNIFHFCTVDDRLSMLETIEGLDLTLQDRNIFFLAPVGRNPFLLNVSHALARCVAEGRTVTIADIDELPLEYLDASEELDLGRLEDLHKAIVLYLWLSYRFNGVFTARAMAVRAKEITEERIGLALEELVDTAAKKRFLKRSVRLINLRETLLKAAEQQKTSPVSADGLASSQDGASQTPLGAAELEPGYVPIRGVTYRRRE